MTSIHYDRTLRLALGSLLLAAALAGCGDDDGDDTSTDDDPTTDMGPNPGTDAFTPDDPDGGGDPEVDMFVPDPFPTLPDVLSITGCEAIPLGPLCSVDQDETDLSLNCGGTILTGTVTDAGAVSVAAAETTNEDGAAVSLTCAGELDRGIVELSCTESTAAVGEIPASETTCTAESDGQILPSYSCMEVPPTLEGVSLCVEGDDMGGETIEAGDCRVIQDGCVFQAECADGLVLTGSVSSEGFDFDVDLVALADAEGDEPAFLEGDTVPHGCSATVEGTTLAGSCGAGRAGRRGMNTSVCSIGGSAAEIPSCDLLAPTSEHLFVLEPCETLESIGQPICAFRQNGCVWDVQCGDNPELSFSGRLEPGATEVAFQLSTGTPCDFEFDADGDMTGACRVPGEVACELSSTDAVPGGAACPIVPYESDFYSRGCAGGDPLDCRVALQHGCNFMAACDFSSRFQGILIVGEASYGDGMRSHLEFNGAPGYECYVDQATEAEITSGDRAANEWYGQCENASGGMCRDNYDPDTGEGFRGLQVFFEE
ncbi:MAG: hypothetical protein JJ863_00830 [Deltaproteobacteria bacterium]|nr:hypothetical protein [Deltaproteobacteria bacterium]